MNKLKTLNKNQLWQLRQEIVLNSLFLNDYENSFGINARECCDFFDGYVEDLVDMARERNIKTDSILDIIELFDNADNLYNYAGCYCGD